MKVRFGCAVAIVLGMAAAGCGKKASDDGGGAGKLASCNSRYHECTEYNQGNRALGDDHLKKLCDGFEGTFATTPCPTAGRAGACKKDEGTKVFYDGYAMPIADVEQQCTSSGGHWSK